MSANGSRVFRPLLWASLAAFLVLPGRAGGQVSFADSAQRLILAGQQASMQRSVESREHAIRLFQLALDQLTAPHQQGRAGTVLNDIGLVYRDLARTDSALAYFRRALEIRRHRAPDRPGEGSTLHNLGVVLYDRGRADSALVYLYQALAVQEELGDGAAQANVLSAVGLAHKVLDRADSAGTYLQRALVIARRLGDGHLEARTLEYLSSLHNDVGRADSANVYVGWAVDRHGELGDSVGAISALISQAYLLPRGDPDSALARLRPLLDAVRRISDPRGESTVLDLIGTAHHTAGRSDSALSYYAQARTIHRQIPDKRGEGATMTHIALVHAALGHADSALAYFRWALPLLHDVGARREVGSALGNMGVLYHNAGTPAGMRRAVAYYDSAAAVMAEVGRSVHGDGDRTSFAELNVPLFESWAMAWLAQEKQLGVHRAAYAALAVAERGRAQALRDLMRRNVDPRPDGEAGAASTAPGADLSAEGQSLAHALSLDQVTAVSYLVTNRTLVAFLVRPGHEVEVFRTLVTADSLDKLVDAVRDGLGVDSADSGSPSPRPTPPGTAGADAAGTGGVEDSGAWYAPAAGLAELLLPEPLRARLPDAGELVIVPSGPLLLLPFAVLPLPSRPGADSLLGLRYAIRYAPSLQVIADLGVWTDIPDLTRSLVVGDPRMPPVSLSGDSLFLDPLGDAQEEGEWVAERVGVRVLAGADATEAAVRARLAHATLIHLATHAQAYTSDARARESFVVLTENDDEDGLLTVEEVMDEVPGMIADLVVLSACQTGLGEPNGAEGTIGLQRAFLARGVRTVLVSQWSVRDAETARLMESFYTSWLGGMTKAEALWLAQREVARQFPNPRIWAAFQVVGAR